MSQIHTNRIATALEFSPATSATVCIVRDTYKGCGGSDSGYTLQHTTSPDNRKNGSAEKWKAGRSKFAAAGLISNENRYPCVGMMAEGIGVRIPTSAAPWWKSEQCLRGDNSVGSARGKLLITLRLDSASRG